jgi:hypothetical protein
MKDNRTDTWPVDPRIHMIPFDLLPGQTHITHSHLQLIVDTNRAYSLDFWTEGENGAPENLDALLLLERFFALIQQMEYAGVNPFGYS